MSAPPPGAHDVALRMDDVGAASKRWEVYAKSLPLPGRFAGIGDVLVFKYLPPLAEWGPYREMSARDWVAILDLLASHRAVLTVAITAAWVTWSGELIPFPDRFPREANQVRRGVEAGLIEVANHGLTHCVLRGHLFRPKAFGSNRRFHREFWDWIPLDEQEDHLRRSQNILRQWLGADVVTFVPPGNVFGSGTVTAAKKHGLRYISCATVPSATDDLAIIGNDGVVPFHDRDVVKRGTAWLGRVIADQVSNGARFRFVRDLGETKLSGSAQVTVP